MLDELQYAVDLYNFVCEKVILGWEVESLNSDEGITKISKLIKSLDRLEKKFVKLWKIRNRKSEIGITLSYFNSVREQLENKMGQINLKG